MRHRKRTAKLGRKGEHRNAMLANLVCSLILHRRVTTTLAKAKAARSMAEKMVTLAKKGDIHRRRLAVARLHQEDAVRILFKEIAPLHKDRNGGYTRIVKLHPRQGDAAPMAILEWVEEPVTPKAPSEPKARAGKKKSRTETASKAKEESSADAGGAAEPAAEAEAEKEDAEKKD